MFVRLQTKSFESPLAVLGFNGQKRERMWSKWRNAQIQMGSEDDLTKGLEAMLKVHEETQRLMRASL